MYTLNIFYGLGIEYMTFKIYNIAEKGTMFIACCCGDPWWSYMTLRQYQLWLSKMSTQKLKNAPKLHDVSFIIEYFKEYEKGCH